MSGFGSNSFGSSALGATGLSDYIFIKKKTISAPSTINAVSIYNGGAAAYRVKTDISESAGSAEIRVFSRTALGESPQLQSTLGGPGLKEITISPGTEVSIEAVIAGASQIVGVTGAG